MLGCGSNNSVVLQQQSNPYGMLSVTVSDPPTCGSSANRPFLHVWVTVTDVEINASSSAGDNDPG
jgi:hypothetical protein